MVYLITYMATISQKLKNLNSRISSLPHLFKFLCLPSLLEVYLGMHWLLSASPYVFSLQTKEGDI